MNCSSGDSSNALALFKACETSFTPAGSGKGGGGGSGDTALNSGGGGKGCETLFTPAGSGKGGGGGDDSSLTAATYHNSLR